MIMNLTVIILTKDEGKNLPYCLHSLKDVAAEIYIVDSGSSDKTLEIAQKHACKIYRHPFENQAKQLNWAIENLPIQTEWVMRLDADERLTPELAEELKNRLSCASEQTTGWMIKRQVYFMSKRIRFGGYYPIWLLRIWRHGIGRCEDRWMDEHVVLSRGKVEKMKYDFIDENHKGLSFWLAKHDGYADREVRDILFADKQQSSLEGNPLQVKIKRFFKYKIYYRLPLFFRPALYFCWRYFFLLGFLDGVRGFMFHFMQGFWYRFWVDCKIYDQRRKT